MSAIQPTQNAALLQVQNLQVQFATNDGPVYAVNGLSFALHQGETLGIVGESGSGKSQTALAIMGLLARNGRATGSIDYQGRNLLALSERQLNTVRGSQIAMAFQDPMTALNPYLTVERQMTETLQLHKGMDRKAARASAIRMLDAVKIPAAASRIGMYPHEFSGGMRQRVMLAMALLCEPAILLADEPTTALDVTVQAQVLALLRELQKDMGIAILLITHDLGVIAGLCDQVLVMYGGRVMEQGSVAHIFHQASHPYTRGLLGAIARIDGQGGPLVPIAGSPPQMGQLPAGCPFAPRCAWVDGLCDAQVPALQDIAVVPSEPALRYPAKRACHRPAALLNLGPSAGGAHG
jgi:oligopeptide transport system ATP-binding protein